MKGLGDMVDFNQINNNSVNESQLQRKNIQAMLNKQRFLQQQTNKTDVGPAATTEISEKALSRLQQEDEVVKFTEIAKSMPDEPNQKVDYYKELWEKQGAIDVPDDIVSSLAGNDSFRRAIGL